MPKTIKRLRYKAFGLSIISDFPLPELPVTTCPNDEYDVVVRRDGLSEKWDELGIHPYSFKVKENYVMFQLPDVAIFLIKNGNEIIVSPWAGADSAQIRLYILGTCMGAILLQRKTLPLHGSAVAIDGKAYAFIGDSGAGKSTLASAFLENGFQLLSDDVIPISFNLDDELPYITPSYPQQKLWAESLNQFGMNASEYNSIYDREDKYLIPVSNKFSEVVLPLSGIFELVKIEQEKIELCFVDGLEKLSTLFTHTYRHLFIKDLGLVNWHFTTSAKIAEKVKIHQIKRPAKGFTAPHLVELILETIKRSEQNVNY
jgi:hypothetical protein